MGVKNTMNTEHTYNLDKSGFYQKYKIERVDGKPFTDRGNEYFVLCFERDPHAKVALKAYAESVKSENPDLYNDLMSTLNKD